LYCFLNFPLLTIKMDFPLPFIFFSEVLNIAASYGRGLFVHVIQEEIHDKVAKAFRQRLQDKINSKFSLKR
jgi:hypothetical protein